MALATEKTTGAAMDFLGFEKLIYHHERIEKIKAGNSQFPLNLTVSLGNYCNHGCLWCTVYAVQKEQARHADFDAYLAFFERAAARGLKAVCYVGTGEPTAYPKFGELIEAVAALGLEQAMFTNGYLLDRYVDRVLDSFTFLRISLDAGSTGVHDAMHDVKGHFPRIIDNLGEIVRRRKSGLPTIGVQFVTHQRNIHDLFDCARIVRDIGADYLSVKPVFNWGGGADPDRIERNNLTYEDMTPEVQKIREAFESRDFEIHYRPFQIDSVVEDRNLLEYDRCVAGFFNLNMYEDGRLTCCSPHKVGVGSIHDDIETIERRILQTTPKLDLTECPASCRYHPMNHLVDTIFNSDGARQYHHNFT